MITFITSLYKPEEYLDGYLGRLNGFARDFARMTPGFEVVIVSNSTSSTTREKLESFIKTNNSGDWLRVVDVPRESLYASWNRGIGLAKNDIIGFWNVDDVRYPEAVMDAMKLIKENSAELVYFPFIIKWYLKFFGLVFPVKIKKIMPPVFDQREFARSMHCGPFFVFNKSLYKKVGPFDEQFKIVGDFDWCVRAAKISDNFARSNKIAGIFGRYYGSNLSGGNARHIAENNVVYLRHNVQDKIKPVGDDLMAGYNPDKIFYNSKN